MDIVWKVFLALLIGIFLVTGSTGIIISNAEVTAADNYFEELSKAIVESNYNEEVIAFCIDEAANNGYKLQVTVEGNSRPGAAKYAKLVFKYNYEIKIFGFSQEKTKQKLL